MDGENNGRVQSNKYSFTSCTNDYPVSISQTSALSQLLFHSLVVYLTSYRGGEGMGGRTVATHEKQ